MLRYTVKAIAFMKEFGPVMYILLITAQCSKVPILTVTVDLINRIPDASMAHQPKANVSTTIRSQSHLILASGRIPEEHSKKYYACWDGAKTCVLDNLGNNLWERTGLRNYRIKIRKCILLIGWI